MHGSCAHPYLPPTGSPTLRGGDPPGLCKIWGIWGLELVGGNPVDSLIHGKRNQPREWTVADLKTELRARDLPSNGRRQQLLHQLYADEVAQRQRNVLVELGMLPREDLSARGIRRYVETVVLFVSFHHFKSHK